MFNWLDLLESHFNLRKKAFLIFDESHVLRYISDYAKDILELDENLIGFVVLNELFPPADKNPHFLVDKDYSFETIHDIVYTTPSGRSKELRINRDANLHSINDLSGYVIWVESKSRDITAIYRKVSSLAPFKNFNWLFSQNNIGFILVNKEGIVEEYNENAKRYFNEPGEWEGRKILTFSSIHHNGLAPIIMKSLKSAGKTRTKTFHLKPAGATQSEEILCSILPLTDFEDSLVGAMITTRPS